VSSLLLASSEIANFLAYVRVLWKPDALHNDLVLAGVNDFRDFFSVIGVSLLTEDCSAFHLLAAIHRSTSEADVILSCYLSDQRLTPVAVRWPEFMLLIIG